MAKALLASSFCTCAEEKLRKENEVLQEGDFKYISSYKDVFVFSRNYKDNEALIIVNLGKKTRKNKVDVTGFYKVLATLENKNEGILLPYEGRVYFKKKI